MQSTCLTLKRSRNASRRLAISLSKIYFRAQGGTSSVGCHGFKVFETDQGEKLGSAPLSSPQIDCVVSALQLKRESCADRRIDQCSVEIPDGKAVRDIGPHRAYIGIKSFG